MHIYSSFLDGTSNSSNAYNIYADESVVETSNAAGFTTNSDGWNMNTTSSSVNASGGTYIYWAFA